MHAFHAIVYPLMLKTGVVWVMMGAVGILSDEIEKDVKLQACVIPEPSEIELAPTVTARLAPEIVKVPLIRKT